MRTDIRPEQTASRPNKPIVPAFLRIGLYVVTLVTPVLVVALVPLPVEEERPGFLELLADNFGLLGFTIVSLQFVLAAGLKWVEWPFGLDMVLHFHRAMAVFASVLLLLHPLLMVAGGETEILTALWVEWPVQLGRFALLVLIATVLISLYRTAFRLSFEQWRRYHNALALTLLAVAFVHSLFAGDDLKSLAMRAIWAALLTTAVSSYAWQRFARPHIEGPAYKVAAVQQQTKDVWTLVLQRADSRPVPAYAPGQFCFLTLHREGLPVEEHPFSISSSPADQMSISYTIKESGDFTRTIRHTRVGDLTSIRGPYGRFSHTFHEDASDLVFIAGGIGITPFISMLRHMRDSRQWRPTLLLYANRTERDILFPSELEDMMKQSQGRFRVVHVLSKADANWRGERGHIDQAVLVRHVTELTKKHFYLCGPARMIEAVGRLLAAERVPPAQIHSELFAL